MNSMGKETECAWTSSVSYAWMKNSELAPITYWFGILININSYLLQWKSVAFIWNMSKYILNENSGLLLLG